MLYLDPPSEATDHQIQIAMCPPAAVGQEADLLRATVDVRVLLLALLLPSIATHLHRDALKTHMPPDLGRLAVTTTMTEHLLVTHLA